MVLDLAKSLYKLVSSKPVKLPSTMFDVVHKSTFLRDQGLSKDSLTIFSNLKELMGKSLLSFSKCFSFQSNSLGLRVLKIARHE